MLTKLPVPLNFASESQFHVCLPWVNACLAYCLSRGLLRDCEIFVYLRLQLSPAARLIIADPADLVQSALVTGCQDTDLLLLTTFSVGSSLSGAQQ